jgi:predicted transcriptional regulator
LTKHDQIIEHIEQLGVGSKISVRRIAKAMDVSEGTAYRAIKDAENQGLVSTIERVGTIRIEKKQKANIEKLTFAEVVNIVDGHVLGGREGLHKTLNKFVIGAMMLEAMMRYVDAGNLLIVGNRTKAHKLSLQNGAAVLITGGFDTSDDVKQLADELQLPVISCSYDTFTVASMINRAIYDRLIKKEIMLVEDIISEQAPVYILRGGDKVSDFEGLVDETGHSRYPVVDEGRRVIGILTSKDVVGVAPGTGVEKVMTKNPLSVDKRTSVASAAHMMVWEGIELLPVVDSHRRLVSVISRQDVLKALQYIQKQPQIGETIEDLVLTRFDEMKSDEGGFSFRGKITPQMTNQLGAVSGGVLTILMTEAAFRALRTYKRGDFILENLTTYYLKPVQIDTEVDIRPRVIEVSRKFAKVDVEVYLEQSLVAKAMLTAQLIDSM